MVAARVDHNRGYGLTASPAVTRLTARGCPASWLRAAPPRWGLGASKAKSCELQSRASAPHPPAPQPGPLPRRAKANLTYLRYRAGHRALRTRLHAAPLIVSLHNSPFLHIAQSDQRGPGPRQVSLRPCTFGLGSPTTLVPTALWRSLRRTSLLSCYRGR